MKLTLIFGAIFLSLILNGQNYNKKIRNINTKIDKVSIKLDSIIKSKETILIDKNKQIISYKLFVDSLEKDLLYFKVKEDFYSIALTEQSKKYVFIMTGILFLVSIFTFAAFRSEVSTFKKDYEKSFKDFEKKIDDFEKNFEKKIFEIETKFDSSNSETYLIKSNLYVVIAKHYKSINDNRNDMVFFFHLLAAGASCKSRNYKINTDDGNDENKSIIANLKSAKYYLDKTEKDKCEYILNRNKIIMKNIEIINLLEDEEAKILIAKIRIKFSTILEGNIA